MARGWWSPLVVAAALFAVPALPQSASRNAEVRILPRDKPLPAGEADTLVRVDSSLVLIPVHVTDMVGATVTGLDSREFHVFEDNVEQAISIFSTEDAPVSVGLLFDTSGSMRTKMLKSCEAASAFFRTANSEDEFFLVEFSDRARLVIPFTGNPAEIYSEIARIKPLGRTTLLDAIHIGLANMKKARYPRKALVIFSDGGDNWSRHSAREVRRTLIESDVQVYAMGIFDPAEDRPTPEERNGPQLLDDLTQQSGGRHFPVNKLDDLPAISERIARELRSQYLVGYHPANPVRDGKYRQVKISLALPTARDLRTSYRRGYYAPPD